MSGLKRSWSVVTLFFEGDAGLMQLQARSFARFCHPSLFREIIVVDNRQDRSGDILRLLDAFGPLRDRVRIIPTMGVVDIPDGVHGWMAQQAIKLAAADLVTTDRFVVLDAKTHLVAPLLPSFLEAPDGRMRINRYPMREHPLHGHLRRSCYFMGVDDIEPFLERGLTRTSTPFSMATGAARAVAREIARLTGKPLAQAMQDSDITEFFSYAAALHGRGVLDELYSFDQPWCLGVWPADAHHGERVAAILRKSREPHAGPFLSVHRGALANQPADQPEPYTLFWGEIGLASPLEVAGLLISKGALL